MGSEFRGRNSGTLLSGIDHDRRMLGAEMHALWRYAAVARVCERVQAALLFTLDSGGELGATDKVLRTADNGLKWSLECRRNENSDGALRPRGQRSVELDRCKLQVDLCFCAENNSSC